jgi:hypothetical protein
MRKYKIEIMRYHAVIDEYNSNDYEKIKKWFKKEYKDLYDSDECTFYVYEDGKDIAWERMLEDFLK